RWLARGGGQPRAPAPKAGDGDDGARRIEWALAIWDEAVSPRRTVVETYLRRRALVLTDALADEVIRYHRKCPWHDAAADKTIFVPAMVVAILPMPTPERTGSITYDAKDPEGFVRVTAGRQRVAQHAHPQA